MRHFVQLQLWLIGYSRGARARPTSDRSGPPLARAQVMYAGGALFLIAIGAILYWAVNYHLPGVDLHTVGLILMAIGAIALLFSFITAATTRRHAPR
jgi:hypothetical protein